MHESVGKAYLLSDHFDGKQSMEAADLRLLAIRLLVLPHSPSGERGQVSCNLDPNGGTDPLGCFLFFLRELLMLWPCRSVFRRLCQCHPWGDRPM